MNISYNWLKRYIALTDDAETVAKILTSIGLEVGTVEKVETIKGGLEGLVVGEVLTCVPHPNSDHLHITTVRLAGSSAPTSRGAHGQSAGETPASPVDACAPGHSAEPVQIVCGAPNVAAGQKVIVATVGTVLYSGDEHFTIKRGKIRGEESLGMICAEDEIGVGTDHSGIIVLPADTPVGMPAREYYHVEDDMVIEVDITPNRSDAASHYGVARDLYAYYQAHGQQVALTKPSVDAFAVQNHDLPIRVTVEATDACPRYTGVSIKGVTIKESPEWLKNALGAIGIRSINNVVDVTNFVLHETGQALHSFDADKIKGNHIIVRRAHEGERFTTLDGVERTMSAADLMICNEEEPMCIAGVFGGLHSGITEQTTNVFLESAYFDPVSIRKTSRRHQLQTDASFRYERGCDPNNTLYILKRCALLIQEVAGGEVAMEITDNGQTEFAPFPVTLNIPRVNALIGKELGEDMLETILRALEITITAKEGDEWQVAVPRYRVDVQRECDVVEDILRIYGYNNVEFPEKLNTSLSYSQKPNPQRLQTRISEQLTAQGFNEILNNSLTKVAYYEALQVLPLAECVKIKNPLSQDLGVMRQTLLFGGLESIQRNTNRRNSDLKFYEFGNCYHFHAEAEIAEGNTLARYTEEPHLALWLTGNRSAASWLRKEEKTSFYALRAYVNGVLTRMGANLDKLTLTPIEANELYSDGLAIQVVRGKEVTTLGTLAIVNRQLTKQFDIDAEVFYADLYWKELLRVNKQFKPVISDLPKAPEVKRDFALLVDKQVAFADLARAAFATERKLLKNVYLFDVYEGKNLETGKKSYALSFILQDPDNTLKDKQIDNIMTRLQKTFEEKFGAKLR